MLAAAASFRRERVLVLVLVPSQLGHPSTHLLILSQLLGAGRPTAVQHAPWSDSESSPLLMVVGQHVTACQVASQCWDIHCTQYVVCLCV